MTRTPIQVRRKPITLLSKAGHKKSGGWYVFAKPSEQPPEWDLGKDERVLWCPWCGEWRIYHREDLGRDHCSHCFAHTEEYYVRDANKIWYEGITSDELRKLNVPRPNGRK